MPSAFSPLARAVEDNAFAWAGSAAEFHWARSWKRGRTLRMFLHTRTLTGCHERLVAGCL